MLSLFSLLLLLLHRSHPGATDRLTLATSFVLSPLQKGVSLATQRVAGFWEWMTSLSHLRDDNERLAAELAAMQAENERLKEVELENQRLQKLLDFKEKVYIRVALARVIGREPSSWFRTVLLDKGSRSGIARNMAVVTNAGIVGRVIDAAPRTAKVMLITDPGSSVSALVQRSRALGVLAGTGRRMCELRHLSMEDDLQTGDQIVTSGEESLFPKGLVVGTIESVERPPNALSPVVTVRPAVNLRSVEEVFVVAAQKD